MKATGSRMPLRKSTATKKQLDQIGSVKKIGKGFPIQTANAYAKPSRVLSSLDPKKRKKK